MGRPPLEVGTYGEVYSRKDGDKWMARARFRDFDGVARPVTKWGATEAEAKRRLKTALRDRKGPQGDGITNLTKVADLADLWMAEVNQADVSTSTREAYDGAVNRHVKKALGGLRLMEVGVPEIDRALKAVRANSGAGSAKTTRSALSGMFKLALRHGAVLANPVRDTTPIPASKRKVRALTRDEVDRLCDLLRADQRAIDLDLPDLVEFMLGTGCRIGEACAVRESVVDLDAGTVEINATVVRVRSRGLTVQKRPKTAAGWRVLALPSFAVDMIKRRDGELRLEPTEGVVFASPKGALRDRSNTSADLREVLDRLGAPEGSEDAGEFAWVTSHVFRKTVATRLDDAGLSARQIADQLGHARPSLTQDLYMGRQVVSAEAARLLDR